MKPKQQPKNIEYLKKIIFSLSAVEMRHPPTFLCGQQRKPKPTHYDTRLELINCQ